MAKPKKPEAESRSEVDKLRDFLLFVQAENLRLREENAMMRSALRRAQK